MSIKNSLRRHEGVRAFFLALILLGAGALLFAAYQYTTAAYAMGQNMAYQIQTQQGGEFAPQNESQAQMLFAADMTLRELTVQQNTAVIIAGVGLMLIAVGWIGRDALREPRAAPPAGQPHTS